MEERSSTLCGDGNGDAAGHNLGWERLNGAGVALWVLGTLVTLIPKYWRMLQAWLCCWESRRGERSDDLYHGTSQTPSSSSTASRFPHAHQA